MTRAEVGRGAWGRGGPGAVCAAVLMLAGAAAVRAQTVTSWLGPAHWSEAVVKRVHARGAAGLDVASRHGATEAVEAALQGGYGAWLAADWPSPSAESTSLRIGVAGGVALERDMVTTGGFTLDRVWRAPSARRDRSGGVAVVEAHGRAARWLGGTVRVEAEPGGVRLVEGGVAAVAGPLQVWAGRRELGYAPADGGGLVLTRLARLDGGGAQLLRPVWGVVTGEVFGGVLPRNGHVDAPWLFGTRLHVAAHARLGIGATRVAVFGGMGGARPGVREVAGVLAGTNLSGAFADDQVASVDAWWRPPVAVPLLLYGEWGMHDIDPGVLFDVPAFTVGVRLVEVPLLADGTVSLEHTQVAGSCCRNPPWYHHFELADGWTVRGEPLGHPLGGHGRQWLVTASGAAGRRLLFDVGVAARRRGPENLFAPVREGHATAVTARLHARPYSRALGVLALDAERGRDWRELRLSLQLRRMF